MLNLNAALTLVDKFLGLRSLVSANQNVSNIVDAVLLVDKQNYQQTKRLAKYFQGKTITATAENIWKFIKLNIKYQADNADQFIKSPSALLHTNIGDCKSFSVFTGSILKNLGIPYTYRFVGFDGKNISHVFVVVKDGNKEIIIDAVWSQFNSTQNFNIKKDYTMSVYSVTGINDQGSRKVFITKPVKDYAMLLLAGSNAIESKGTSKTVLLTVNEVDAILQKAQNLKETSGVGRFRPFGWLKNQVDNVITSCKGALKSIMGNDLYGKYGEGLFTTLLIGTGAGPFILGLGALSGLGWTKITSFDGNNFAVKLTDLEIAALQMPNENNPDYSAVVLKLAGQFSALASIIALTYVRDKQAKSNDITNAGKLSSRKISGTESVKNTPVNLINYQETEKFKEDILNILAAGWQHPFNPLYPTDFTEWKTFRTLNGGVGNIVDMMLYIANNLPLKDGVILSPEYANLFFTQVVAKLEQNTYKAHKTQAAQRLWDYMFATNNTIKLPTPASSALSNSSTGTGLDEKISPQTADLLSNYNIPVTKNMTVSQAILALKTDGQNVPNTVIDDATLKAYLIAQNGGNGGNGGNNAGNDKKGSLILPISLIALLLN